MQHLHHTSATASKTSFRWFKTVVFPFGSTQINAIDGNSFNAFSNITLTESASGTEKMLLTHSLTVLHRFREVQVAMDFSSPWNWFAG
jgi:hypothetical protein